MRSKLPAVLLLAPLAISCGGDDGPQIKRPDAGSGSGSGSAGETCAMDSAYTPDAGSNTQTQFADDKPTGYFGSGSGSNPMPSVHQIWYGVGLGDLNADLIDVLYIDLYAEYGGFGSDGDIRPGSYAIANDELSYAKCGICVYGAGDLDANSGDVAQWYMATGGNVMLTTVTLPSGSAAGRIAGSWSGINLQHVEDDGNGFIGNDATAVGSCTSSIADASFDIPLAPPQGSGSGSATGKPNHIRIPVLRHRRY